MPSFYHRFLNSVSRFPDFVAVEVQLAHPSREVRAVSYRELRERSEAVAAWLRENGVAKGSRCAILAANSAEWVAAYFGAMAAGCVAVPLDTAFHADQVAKLLLDCGSSVLFTDKKHAELSRQSLEEAQQKGLQCRIVGLQALEGLPDIGAMPTPKSFSPDETSAEDIAVILYTSGTTSDPKGVMLSHGNIDAEATAVFKFIRIDETDAILGVLPLFHALAQMANLLFPFSVGARAVYLEELNTTELMRALRERRITLFCCVPQFFYLIHEKVMKQVQERGLLARLAFGLMMRASRAARGIGVNLGKVFFKKVHATLGTTMRYFITGGSRFDAQIGKDLETLGFDILQAYGLTECCGGATVTGLKDRFTGSVGKGLPGVEIKIGPSSVEGTTEGEVLIAGPNVMKGYYNRPDATAEILKNGWLHTGDLGYTDHDGNLFITGRQKDVIVLSSGKNIYPEEIEAHYAQSPFIKELCVMGLEGKPGEALSERLHAVIVPDMDVLRQKKIVNINEVVRFDVETYSQMLPSTKRILSYDIWLNDLPRTTTRKLKRFQIQKEAASQADQVDSVTKREFTAEDTEWMSHPDVARAISVVQSVSKKEDAIHPADNLELDLGLDSMERVELVVALEQELHANADENMISEVYTVRELIETVRAGMSAEAKAKKAGWEEVFATETDDPHVKDIVLPQHLATAFWYGVGIAVSAISKLFFGLKVKGLENLPAKGPYIISPNHQSFIDAPVLNSQFPYSLHKQLFYVGTSEIFGSGAMRFLAKTIKLIPVDPDSNLVPAMRAGSYGLKHGRVLVLFPEGERTIDGTVKLFKKGAAILSYHHQVPIIPVALEGFYEAWPRGAPFLRRSKLQITIGKPIQPPPKIHDRPETAYEALTNELKASILREWEPMHAQNAARTMAAHQ